MNDFIEFFFNTQTMFSIPDVLLNILLSSILAFIVRFIFIRYAVTMSNRKIFGNIFFLVTVCTTLIISIIQSSIALSLGLVGALSIVRFRTAVKEPEELVYLFLCIAIGIGFGANERLLTLIASLFILIILLIRGIGHKRMNTFSEVYNFDLISANLSLDQVMKLLQPFCDSLALKKYSTDENFSNICLSIELRNIQKLELAVAKIKEIDQQARISFIPNSTIS